MNKQITNIINKSVMPHLRNNNIDSAACLVSGLLNSGTARSKQQVSAVLDFAIKHKLYTSKRWICQYKISIL